MVIEGLVKKIIYSSLDGSYYVLKVVEEKQNSSFFKNSRNNGYIVVVKGGPFYEGEYYHFDAQQTLSAKYGDQFEAKSYYHIVSNTVKGLTKYILSLDITGIGEKKSEYIVNALGIDFFSKSTILIEELSILSPKIKQEQIETLYYVMTKPKVFDDIKKNLYSYGLTTKIIAKLISKYEEDTLSTIQNNPYILIDDINNIGFKKADEIALKMGLAEDSHQRIKAAIIHIFKESHFLTGDSFIVFDDILERYSKLIPIEIDLNYYLSVLCEENKIVEIDNKFYLKNVYDIERKLADKMISLNTLGGNITSSDAITKLDDLEKQYNITYTKRQREAIINSLTSNFSIITGGPGTGKTTIVKAILEIYLSLAPIEKRSFRVCAPTGKAAKRLSEVIGCSATTIHVLLKFDTSGKFFYNELNPLETSFIIVDEASMIDLYLANSLFSAIPDETKILFVGDVNQLPSIGPGQILFDMINANIFNTTRLIDIIRQDENSNIVKISKQILEGNLKLYEINNGDVSIKKMNSENIGDFLSAYYINNQDEDLLILSAKRSGSIGIDIINLKVQDTIIKRKENKIKQFGRYFYERDKVIQTKNNYNLEVMNGEIGYIDKILKGDEEESILVNYDNRSVYYNKNDLNEIDLAYAISVHKSQGSEAQTVIFVVNSESKFMLNKELIYTAITRAKKNLIIVGEPGLLVYYCKRLALKRKTSLF